ncbi:MAG: ATP-binding protein [Planctomycetota bacterium]|nr:ATP-binding protein [Planctomycetota bacterium]
MFERREEVARVLRLLEDYPAVAILGTRQIGKTTLAKAVARRWKGPRHLFDLERRRHAIRLADPETALEPLRGLVVIDEVQREPGVFAALRPLADRERTPARFLVLGSATPRFLRQTSESLAGRIAHFELEGLGLKDSGGKQWSSLWTRGGYPRSLSARSASASFGWRRDIVRAYLERDLSDLGLRAPATTIERFWIMLAHYHGQIWNGAEFARSFAISEATVRRYLEVLESTYMVRVLRPWAVNTGKRLVKSPKVYVADSGILHELLELRDAHAVQNHPKVGASFEGFALYETVRRLGASRREISFWATHQGAELDLLVVRGKQRLGFEFKHTTSPEVTKSMRIAIEDLALDRLDVVHVGEETYPLAPKIRAVSIARLTKDVDPLA